MAKTPSGRLSKKTFGIGMSILASVFEKIERITLNSDLMEAWYRMLSDLTDEEFKYSIEVIVKTFKFPPTIAEIREEAKEYSREVELTPEEAWALVYRDIHVYGYYREPVYDDWKLEAAKNAIGWHTLCDMTEETKEVIRAHFMRIYESFRNRQKYAEVSQNPKLASFIHSLARSLAPGSSVPQLENPSTPQLNYADKKALPK